MGLIEGVFLHILTKGTHGTTENEKNDLGYPQNEGSRDSNFEDSSDYLSAGRSPTALEHQGLQ